MWSQFAPCVTSLRPKGADGGNVFRGLHYCPGDRHPGRRKERTPLDSVPNPPEAMVSPDPV